MKFGSMKKIAAELKELRKKGPYSLSKYMRNKFNATPAELYKELGIDFQSATVEMMYNTEDAIVVFGEWVRDAIIVGMQETILRQHIFATSQRSDSKLCEVPYVDVSGIASGEDEERLPGTSIETDSIDLSSKWVRSREIGKAVKFPYGYERINKYKLEVVATFLKAYGNRIMRQAQRNIVDTLMTDDGGFDADQVRVDFTPPTIGVEDPSIGIQQKDYTRAVNIMAENGKPVSTLLGNSEITTTALDWPVFTAKVQEKIQTKANIHLPLPAQLDVFPVAEMPTDKMALVCVPQCLAEYIVQDITVDEEKIASKRIRSAIAVYEFGIGIMMRNARLVIDQTLQYDKSQIPAWMSL